VEVNTTQLTYSVVMLSHLTIIARSQSRMAQSSGHSHFTQASDRVHVRFEQMLQVRPTAQKPTS
jgi:hypothetical protein